MRNSKGVNEMFLDKKLDSKEIYNQKTSKNKNNKKINNEQKIHIIEKKAKLKQEHKDQKLKIKKTYKSNLNELKLNLRNSLQNLENKNKKEILKFKITFKIESKNLKNDFCRNYSRLKSNQLIQKNNLKIEILDFKNPISIYKNQNYKVTNLLVEKQKEKRNKLLIENDKKNYLEIIKNIPIRIFKEMRRVRWANKDTKIGIKFIQVVILVIVCALLIWGIETGLTALLKLIKISTY